MHHESLVFLVQCRNRKLLFTNDLYPSGRRQRFGGAISSLDKLLLCKLYVYIVESEEKHPQDYFHSGVGHQKDLLEELNISQLVLKWEAYYDYSKDIQMRFVDFLGSHVSLPNAEFDFLGVCRIYYVNFAIQVK